MRWVYLDEFAVSLEQRGATWIHIQFQSHYLSTALKLIKNYVFGHGSSLHL